MRTTVFKERPISDVMTNTARGLVELLENPYPPVAVYHCRTAPFGSERVSDDHCVIRSFFLPAVKEGRSVYGSPSDIRCGGPASGFCIRDDEHRIELADAYSKGNGYFDSPERVVDNYLDALPVPFTTGDVIVFEPLSTALERGIEPEVVVFLTDPLHISALMTLAGYARESSDSPVEMRYALGCENLYLMPILESRKEDPKCVIGLTEFFVRKFIDPDKFSFSIPYSLFRKMDGYAEETFLSRGRWNKPLDPSKMPPRPSRDRGESEKS